MSSRPQPRGHAPNENLPHLFPRAAPEMRFVTAWLWRPIRQGLETLLRFGVRPSVETILQIDVDQFPGIGALGREQAASSTTKLGSVFPEGEAGAPHRTSTDSLKRQPSNDSI